MKNSLSIVCATIDSQNLVNRLVASIDASLVLQNEFWEVEIIIIDQNQLTDRLSAPISKNANVTCVHSNKRGLSHNRNIGIKVAKYEWIMFLDADCSLSLNFFQALTPLVNLHKDAAVLLGQVRSEEEDIPIFRPWPDGSFKITGLNVWQYCISVNCIYRRCCISLFDERFGIGARFGSCEDIDFSLATAGEKIYTDSLVVFHPHQSFSSQPVEKIYAYSSGFGALCRKRIFGWGLPLLTLSILIKLAHCLIGRITYNRLRSSILGRINGFLSYK